MELNLKTWGDATLQAALRVLEPFKSKEFLTPFDPNMPGTPENIELVMEQIEATLRHERAAKIAFEFLEKLVPEVAKVISEMERRQNEQGD